MSDQTKHQFTVEKFKPYKGASFWMAKTIIQLDELHKLEFKTYKQYGMSLTSYELFNGYKQVKSLWLAPSKIQHGEIKTATKKTIIEYHIKSMDKFQDIIDIAKKVIEHNDIRKNEQ